jgi:hypothetical protein
LNNEKIKELSESAYTVLEIKKLQDVIAVKDAGENLFNYSNGELTQISSKTKFFKISKNIKTIFSTKGKTGIYYTNNLDEIHFYSVSEKKDHFMTMISGKIANIFPFLNGDVLLYISGQKVSSIDSSATNIYSFDSVSNDSISIIDMSNTILYLDLNKNLVLSKIR